MLGAFGCIAGSVLPRSSDIVSTEGVGTLESGFVGVGCDLGCGADGDSTRGIVGNFLCGAVTNSGILWVSSVPGSGPSPREPKKSSEGSSVSDKGGINSGIKLASSVSVSIFSKKSSGISSVILCMPLRFFGSCVILVSVFI